MNGAEFLRGVIQAFPYAIHTVLTDNGMAFADLPKNRGRYPAFDAIFGGHIFDRVCAEHGIKHKLTKPYHPWTNGQAERMNRTVKDATIKAFPLSGPRKPQGARACFRVSLQLRKTPRVPQVENTVRNRLSGLDCKPRHLQTKPKPPHPGTIHLTYHPLNRLSSDCGDWLAIERAWVPSCCLICSA